MKNTEQLLEKYTPYCKNGLISLTQIFYPATCLICNISTDNELDTTVLCSNCVSKLDRCKKPMCDACGIPLVMGAYYLSHLCRRCRTTPPRFDKAVTVWTYTSNMKKIIKLFKYNHKWKLGKFLAKEMSKTAKIITSISHIDAIISVPRHWAKKRWYGFDHAQFLAKEVANHISVPYFADALVSTKWTRSQTRLSNVNRRLNIKDAYRAVPVNINNRSVILIDDVLTSAATANTCADILKSRGVNKVFVITAASTPQQYQQSKIK